MWLIAGLGNPGAKYNRTPHNLGYEVVDLLVRRHGLRWQNLSKWPAMIAGGNFDGDKLYFMKPLTYMNRSADAVRPFADYYKIPTKNCLAVCDDVNLPFGKIRLRESGSHGGHNGLRDLIQNLGTQDFPRLRIGCAPMKPVHDLAAYVLGSMWGEGLELAELAIEVSADCIETVLSDGTIKAMARYNGWSGKPAE
ncbi:aminoacyl-tRNA hydrolase [bacterium]|nr:aminoacyl-tRNA hydrolase [bacterium]